MNGEFYVEMMGCLMITALTGLVVTCALWLAVHVAEDIVKKQELRRWRKETTRGKK